MAIHCFSLSASAGGVSFATPVILPTGLGCSSVVAADLNGDGWLDLAAANRGGNNDVSVLMNLGEGNFAPAVSYPIGPVGETRPRTVISADVNGDGHIDLLTANEYANTVAVLLNDGTGIFADPIHFPVANAPTGLDAGDFNGNGRMDIAVTHRGTSSGPLQILLNLGNKGDTWQGLATSHSYSVGSDSREVAVGDYTGDGHADVMAVNRGSKTITLLLGNGDGSFTPGGSIFMGGMPRDVALADFTGNGLLDAAVADYETHKAWILLNEGIGESGWNGFAAPVGYDGLGTAPHGITTADILNNGIQDVVMANVQAGGTISVMINDGNGVFNEVYLFSNGAQTSSAASVTAADLTGDGLADIATSNLTTTGNVSFLRNITDTTEPPGDPDINADGVVDVTDLLIVLEHWGECPGSNECPADLNDDGTVDVADMLILLSAWGPMP